MSERRRNTHENTTEPTRSKHVIDNPLSIDRDEDSIKLTGSTAASDMKFYFGQIKKQNTE